MGFSFNDIPPELIYEIFAAMDPKTLLHCCSVCRLWNGTIQGSLELQYAIELLVEGMVPGSLPMGAPQALQALQASRHAWRNLKWRSKLGRKPAYGYNLIQRLSICHAWELAGGLFVQQKGGTKDLLSVVFSSGHGGDPRVTAVEKIRANELREDLRDIAIDPTQDLIVRFYASFRQGAVLVCRTISTEEYHPLASNPALELGSYRHPFRGLSMQLAGDVTKIAQWAAVASADFHLLSPRSYVLLRAPNSRAEADAGQPGQIDIFTFRAENYNDPTQLVTLLLPETVRYMPLTIPTIDLGPFIADPIPGIPFSKSNEHRICVFLLEYNFQVFFRLFVPYRYFHRYIAISGDDGESLRVPIVKWEEWGPQNSRMLSVSGRTERKDRQVHGERALS
ncbi:F-box domain-containing protein [Favolaschia claudopus]|uniref:F-box domain-containing protein n=1 Tax=Favolaschia claudopus TaxID=2862362 RepID=A0AAW0AG01_9AGAR